MSKITDYARGKPCTIRLPVCNGNPETSVWAHINSIRWGAGRGIKGPDICGAIACSSCHDIIDGRVYTTIARDNIKLSALEGHMESIAMLDRDGIIGILK